jgi:hypothetical protein
MKGLALIMGAAKKPPPDEESAEDEDSADDSGGSEMEFARIAADAFASGDKEAGAEALVKTIKACMGGYGPKE